MPNIVVFASGSGTNFKAIVEATQHNIIQGNVRLLICNNETAGVVNIASQYNIPCYIEHYHKGEDRSKYYLNIIDKLFDMDYEIDLIVLAGWMLMVSENFINIMKKYNCSIINLHPALPGQFPGVNAIERAWTAYKENDITESGLMVHHVVKEMDAGELIDFKIVPFYNNDTFESFSARLRWFEKPTLISAINKVLTGHDSEFSFNQKYESVRTAKAYDYVTDVTCSLLHEGKVRNCFAVNIDKNILPYLIIYHSDRLSAFDHHICEVEGKGNILMLQNIWWMKHTKHIIANHYITHFDNAIIAERCSRISLEVIVRRYITGSTRTSLWTQYNNGVRDYCGNKLPEGLVKNQKLDNYLITPTTKEEEEDKPITPHEIVLNGILEKKDWDYIAQKALELFLYGEQIADDKGLILVDTKYEFGFNKNGNIILIDEIHTSDSSRFWLKDTYNAKISAGEEPDKLDKDAIRDWLYANSDPQNPEFTPPEIPSNVKDNVYSAYHKLYQMLIGQKTKRMASQTENIETLHTFNNSINFIRGELDTVLILTNKYGEHTKNIINHLAKLCIVSRVHIVSLCHNMNNINKIIQGYKIIGERLNKKYIYIVTSEEDTNLAALVATNTSCPVIASSDTMDINLNYSMLQSWLLIKKSSNVAFACYRMFSMK